jgi:transcriptional regulator with XRE-family HTH domain
MQHVNPLISLVFVVLWLAYVYKQHLDLAWLFAIVSRLRRARKARGWSIEEAAWQVGVNTSTYHRWELGVQRPHGRNLHKLEAAFQMRASDLFEKDSLENVEEKYASLVMIKSYLDTVAQHDGHLYLFQIKSSS